MFHEKTYILRVLLYIGLPALEIRISTDDLFLSLFYFLCTPSINHRLLYDLKKKSIFASVDLRMGMHTCVPNRDKILADH